MKKNKGIPLILFATIALGASMSRHFTNPEKPWNTPDYIIIGCCLVLIGLGIYANFKSRPAK